MQPPPPRRHHYVPKFYLEYFAREQDPELPRFWVYDKDGAPPRAQVPLNTAVIRDLYTFLKPDGSKDVSIETELFSKIESETKPILDRWRKHLTFTPEDVVTVTLFMALLHTRVPRNIRTMQEFVDKLSQEWWKELGRDRAQVEKIWREFIEPAKEKVWSNIDELQDHMVNFEKYYIMQSSEKYALVAGLKQAIPIHKHMLSMVPQLMVVPNGNFFATSDSPVNVFASRNDGVALFGAGFGLANVQIFFPISPTLGLYLSRERKPPLVRTSGRRIIDLNRRCVYMAERFVFSPHRSARIARHIKEFASTRGAERLDTKVIAESKGYC
jgi:Protein of unknown function (DUF4238)